MHLSNEVLWVLFLLFDMTCVVLMHRFFGKAGLYAYTVVAIIACNIQVLKLVEVFGMSVTMGNVLYGSIFLCADILVELYGKQAARTAVWLGFVSMVLMTLYMQYALLVQPSAIDQAHPHLQALFGFLPRIAFASLTAYLLSQMHDVWAFWRIKLLTKSKWLWLRSNASTLVSQLIDTAVFTLLAFAPLPGLGFVPGFESWSTIRDVALTTYVLKVIVSVCDTPFIYWARQWHWSLERKRAAGTAVAAAEGTT